MQNLLIAFMTGIFESATSNVKLAVLSYRADLIADYETLEKPFGSERGNPRYIYYIGSSEYQKEWLDKAQKHRETQKSLLIEDIDNQLLTVNGDDDDDDDDKFLNVESSLANKSKNDQKLELTVEDVDDNEDKIIVNEKFLELQNEIKKMQNDVAGRFNVVEENLAELLSLIKSK